MTTTVLGLAAFGLALSAGSQSAEQPLSIADLSSQHALQLRCTMLAGMLENDAERGLAELPAGLAPGRVEPLTEALHAELATVYGATESTTKALLKADFEAFSRLAAQAAEQPQGATNSGWVEAQFEPCRSHWQGRDPALVGTPPDYYGAPVDAAFCHALTMLFADAIAAGGGDGVKIAELFRARADRIEQVMLAQAGGDPSADQTVAAKLAAAADGFDPERFDALVEQDAEEIMTWCERLAGPD